MSRLREWEIPGFRRGSWWRAVLAVLSYSLIALLFLGSLRTPFAALIFLLAALGFVAVLTNFRGLHQRLLGASGRSQRMGALTGAAIVLGVVALAAFGASQPAQPKAASPPVGPAPSQPTTAPAPRPTATDAPPTEMPAAPTPTALPAATAAPPTPVPAQPTVALSTSAPAAPVGFDPRRYLGQGDRYNCGDFTSQAEAQAVLRADPSDPNRLDTNRQGIACESRPPPRDLTPVARPR